MKRLFTPLISGATLALAMGFSGQATAADTWDLGGGCFPSACISSSVTATLAGYDATGSGSAYVLGTSGSGGLTDQGSLGIGYTSSIETSPVAPDHAFDNRAGESGTTAGVEMLLISFGTSKVALTGMATGWSQTDSDISVLRWDGAGAPTAGGTTVTSAGWTLISSKDVDGVAANTGVLGGGTFALSAGTGANKNDTKVSSWWMISTYFGATDGTNNLDSTANDFFKILSFTGNICTTGVTGGSAGTAGTAGAGNGGTCSGGSSGSGVPEPGSLALFGVAALAAVGARRRWLKRG